MNTSDLHVHSKYSSDGELNIQNIIDLCRESGLNTFSLTDHNTVKGIDEAASISVQKNIDFIPGIEIDCNYKDTDLHVLGYNINWKSDDFIRLQENISSKVKDSLIAMINNLKHLGFVINTEDVITAAKGKLPTGELIAEVMLSDKQYYSPLLIPYMKNGDRSDMPYINFYLDYFAQGKPAYVRIDYMPYTDAIDMIKDNGGIAIIAHPGLNFNGKEQISEELLSKGAEGLEVFNNYHNQKQIDYFTSVVKQRNVLMTCGSDFHGKNKPLIKIGQFKSAPETEDYLQNSIYKIKTAPPL